LLRTSGTYVLWLHVVNVDTEDMVVINASAESGDCGPILILRDTRALENDTLASTKFGDSFVENKRSICIGFIIGDAGKPRDTWFLRK
jgi:hypothetical protein